ncbi:uncharacterized protein LOC110733402 isoform X1 [Chenopodium quinoa]|uniref:uncharacterized protein LOC110733402 isoform X1 n=1 Tax=Chenopodium quinoa TaxID=63459 RepID=UPI000B784376|nr:uncharacterized protein LOC110733402 isoform X1 [Chenopodium quinoa]
MADSKRQESMNSDRINGEDDFRRFNSDENVESEEASSTVESSVGNSTANAVSNGSASLADRLGEILVDEGNGDLLLQQSDRENNFLQWLQALDVQHMGACRADERLKPLLKANASSGAAEDRLLSHLSQHFETSEVGLLARCLCVPLVSMRVGKVLKQGSMLCPTSARGNLNLALLPSSDLRISFVGDNGQTERLATLSDTSECSAVIVEEIPADHSGRSFVMKLPDGDPCYFWCSEKSKLLGSDLLWKMKDLLKRKPTLTELTGISESRLECFATHLRAYLVGPSVNNFQASSTALSSPWTNRRSDNFEVDLNAHSSTAVRPLRTRQCSGQTMKGHTQYLGSLSPRPSSFKEGLPRVLTSLRSTSREKLRRRGDLHLPVVDSSFMNEPVLNLSDKGKSSEAFATNAVSPVSFLESLGNSSLPESSSATIQIPPIGSFFSPYYCWCPPCTSPSVASISKLPTPYVEPFSLPPLSTLLPATGSHSMLSQIPPLDLASVPSLEFPAFLSDPLSRLSFSTQNSQFQSFTPLMCDPIVHIPVVDVCSSGQGYLVSAGPGIATSIPPLYPKLVGPMISESESMVDKGARETLRLLLGSSSSQSSASLMGVFPGVLNDKDKQGFVVAGSRGLYSGISDVNAIVNSFAAVGLTSVSERSARTVGLRNFGKTTATDGLEHTFSSVDFQDSTFMSNEEETD